MVAESNTALSEFTQCLPFELYGDRGRRASRFDDSHLRALRVELYAERLMHGLDLWSGRPLDDAGEEAARITAQQMSATREVRRCLQNNCAAGCA